MRRNGRIPGPPVPYRHVVAPRPLAFPGPVGYNPSRGKEKGAGPVPWYVYILRCGDGTLYTGATDDVGRRLAAHRAGRGAKYTRGRGPLELVYVEEQPDKSAALRREWEIKRLRREQKEQMIRDN